MAMATTQPTTFGQRLKVMCLARGLSFRRLSEAADLAPCHVANLVRRDDPNPDRKTLEALCRELGCTLDYLCLGRGDPPPYTKIGAAA